MAQFTRNVFTGGPCNPDGSSQANALGQVINKFAQGNQQFVDHRFFMPGQEFEQLPPQMIMNPQFHPQFQESWENANELEAAWREKMPPQEMMWMREMQRMEEAWRQAPQMEQKQLESA